MCHIQSPYYEEGIFETLGLAAMLDFEAFTRIQNILFDTEYNLLSMEDAPRVYVDEDFQTSPDDEARLITFIKRTRTVENLVPLLATLPRIRRLEIILVVKPPLSLRYFDDEEDVSAESVNFEKSGVVGERATELFMECGILDPLRKLTNVEDFVFEIQTRARKLKVNSGIMVLKPKYAKMAQDLTETTKHNWTARNSIH